MALFPGNASFGGLAIRAVVALGILALLWLAVTALGIPIPYWVLQALGIVLIVIFIVFLIRLLTGASGP
jgi:hypothetical protein